MRGRGIGYTASLLLLLFDRIQAEVYNYLLQRSAFERRSRGAGVRFIDLDQGMPFGIALIFSCNTAETVSNDAEMSVFNSKEAA